MSSRKRKFRGNKAPTDSSLDRQETRREPDPSLFIQAYEADIVHGAQAKAAVAALEVGGGDGLILWGQAKSGQKLDNKPGIDNVFDCASADIADAPSTPEIWVDRYDARLLLETLPSSDTPRVMHRDVSPSGWSDLSSDAEDTFFLDAAEVEAYKRDKRRRVLDRDREARLKALQDSEALDHADEEIWGDSDEEPEEEQQQLMSRTAKHLVSSPNPAQLEMRILANHGSDKRFAFLRGRWKRTWKIILGKSRLELQAQESNKTEVKSPTQKTGGLGGLSGYGDSDSEEGKSDEYASVVRDAGNGEEKAHDEDLEEALKEARRLRAKEWAQKRRELREDHTS